MTKYYFCNFLSDVIDRDVDRGVTRVEIDKDFAGSVLLAEAYIEGSTLKFVQEGSRCNGEAFDFIGEFSHDDKKVRTSEEALMHTPDNPIVVIATEKFSVPKGINTYFKYMPVKGGVIVALIKGCIIVSTDDGEMVPMVRNYNNSHEGLEEKEFTAKDIAKLNILVDRESDIPYSDYVVSDCIVSFDLSSDGKGLDRIKFCKEHFNFLCKEVFEEGKVAKEEKDRLKKEELERKRIEYARMDAALKAKEESEAREKAEAEKAKKSRARKQPEGTVEVGAIGAASFLEHIRKVQNSK